MSMGVSISLHVRSNLNMSRYVDKSERDRNMNMFASMRKSVNMSVYTLACVKVWVKKRI